MRKLLLVLLIAVVGAGIAFGANAVFFSPTSAERPASEPRGLVDEIAADDEVDEATPKPSPSPSPSPDTDGDGTSASGGSGGPAPNSDDGDGPQTPRSASRVEGGPQPTTFVVQGVVDEQDPPDDPCDLEESEAEQRECENEADREEDEREAEQDEARDDADDD